MYEVFLLCANRTVFFATCDERFAMDCTVTLYMQSLIMQSKLLLFVCNLTLLPRL